MMTFEEAFAAATLLLDQRGQLLNAHLFRLVEGDEGLYRQVRDRLILVGVAEDRSGVGLARTELSSTAPRDGFSAEIVTPSSEPDFAMRSTSTGSLAAESESEPESSDWWREPEWWLMTSGVVRGPMDLITLCQMRQHGEIKPADVVRHGIKGLWQRPDEFPVLAAAKPNEALPASSDGFNLRRYGEGRALSKAQKQEFHSAAASASSDAGAPRADVDSNGLSGRSPSLQPSESILSDSGDGADAASEQQKKQFVLPEKSWSLGNQIRPGLFARGWHTASGMVGGSKRLGVILLSIVAVGLFVHWWQQPPAASAIYNEFTTCRGVLKRLQDRRVGRAEWEEMTNRYRPRISRIVDRLQPRATERYPSEQSLYQAGKFGLIPMFDSPNVLSGPEQTYETQMDVANKLINGGKPR